MQIKWLVRIKRNWMLLQDSRMSKYGVHMLDYDVRSQNDVELHYGVFFSDVRSPVQLKKSKKNVASLKNKKSDATTSGQQDQ